MYCRPVIFNLKRRFLPVGVGKGRIYFEAWFRLVYLPLKFNIGKQAELPVTAIYLLSFFQK